MSEVLGRTWAFLTSSGAGPRWTVPSNQSTQTSHLPHGLAQFMQAVFDAPTLDHQKDIIRQQLAAVESKLKEPRLKTNILADCIVRSMVCYIAVESGHSNIDKCSEDQSISTRFCHIHALQLAQQGTVPERKLGYLACALMLHESDDLLLLLVNTILRDLKSTNVVEINMALIAVASSNLVPSEMAPLLVPIIAERTKHSKDFIRKKALICLGQLYKNKNQPMSFSSSFTGSHISPEMNNFLEEHVQASLTDVDPGVVGTAIQVLTTIISSKQLYSKEKDLIPLSYSTEELIRGLLSIQEQILDGKLPQKEYGYHELPAPWMQVDILHLLSLFFELPVVKLKITAHEWLQAAQVLLRTFEHISLHGGSKNMIGHAIDLECAAMSSTLLDLNFEPNKIKEISDAPTSFQMLRKNIQQKSWKHMVRFIQSKNNNMKYAGLCGVEKLLLSGDKEATSEKENIPDELQNGIMISLESSDPVVRQKALSLLPLMASAQNVQSICDKIIGQLRLQKIEDSLGRKDLIEKVLAMAEKFFSKSILGAKSENSEVSFDWYVFVLVRLLQAAHGEQRELIIVKIKRVLLKNKKNANDHENYIEKNDAQITDEEMIKVGSKLTGILRKLVFSNLAKNSKNDQDKIRVQHDPIINKGPPITVLMLYLWCESHFFMHTNSSGDKEKTLNSDCDTETSNNLPGCDNSNENGYKRISYSVDQILKIGEMHKEMLLEANFRLGTSNKQKEKENRQKRCQKAKKVLMASLDALFYVITCIADSGLNDIPNSSFWIKARSFAEEISSCNSSKPSCISFELIDSANEILFLMKKFSNHDIAIDLRQSNANADDFTLSYLDGIVVSALEKSGAFAEVDHSAKQSFHPYIPNKSWKLREKLKKEKEIAEKMSNSNWNTLFTEKREESEVRDESKSVETLSIIETHSSATSQSFSNIPELWSIEGRTKSPVSNPSFVSSREGTTESNLTKPIKTNDSQNINNNNVKEENTPFKSSTVTSTSAQEDQQEVEEAIDVLQNLDNWTD